MRINYALAGTSVLTSLQLSIFLNNHCKGEDDGDVLDIEDDDDGVDIRIVYYLTIDDRWRLGKCTFGWLFRDSTEYRDQDLIISVAAKMVLQKIVERVK